MRICFEAENKNTLDLLITKVSNIKKILLSIHKLIFTALGVEPGSQHFMIYGCLFLF